ncbi:SMI1/KNR4 family protein [Streptomyces sp. CB01881]|uniref:SMI1/KNR4 family protein n=1 Tax=Streptomyces sp. CB01881 TaxID=2078691 RepID=UPI000CDC30CF|nr:SMI1/KNR4 family protein [Streptomyces sp. CB01881]AUY47649.1 SMI1/KNR4 family protein [Streptomyces sp. CB01881]TYC76122.1 SMI1/KNR4 family protein [Streptomyces sp. CB01881]
MNDQENSTFSIHDFRTWEPVLRLLRAEHAEQLAAPGGRVVGLIGRGGWSVPLKDMTNDAVWRVHRTLVKDGVDAVTFAVEIEAAGRTRLRMLESSPAVEPGIAPNPGALVLVEDSLPEPWRRLPDPAPGAVPAPSADPALLERTLRERLPNAVGATEAEIAAAEMRLGVTLPEELKALYRVTRADWADWVGDYEAASRHSRAVGCELFGLAGLYVAEAATRECPWQFAALEVVDTRPCAAVQGLAGSPGWIVFGDNGGGDRLAVDLTPGPRGHTGQIILISHEQNIGAKLVADSLTDLVLDRPAAQTGSLETHPPAAASANAYSQQSLEDSVHPGLEVLSIGMSTSQQVSLAPLIGLPRLRTLSAHPGTLADPLEITELTGLEYLELGSHEWRVLLDANVVPRSLLAAAVKAPYDGDPLALADLVNELLALWDRPPITRTVIEGDLGPVT